MQIIRYLDAGKQALYAAREGTKTYQIDGDIFTDYAVTRQLVQPEGLLAPVTPSQIIGIGLNYRRHAAEAGAALPEYPVVFTKTLNTLQHPEHPIVLPTHLASYQVDYECELAVVIGKRCKNVSEADALDAVLGYCCANDVSARDWQLTWGGGQWSRGKSFDTFCPLGPWLVTPDEIPDPNDLTIRTILNGEVVQDWNTGDIIFDVAALISFLSGSTTLLPGTVILTGTPHGVGMAQRPPRWLRPGDEVSVEIEKIGKLTNRVVSESDQPK